jgi:hypothetical protein
VVDGWHWTQIIRQDIQCRERLRAALRRTRSPRYLRKMREASVAALRQFARGLLHPNNSRSTITISSGSNPEPLHNRGSPYRPQMHEHGPSPDYPYARNPPTKVQSSNQLPRIVLVSPREHNHGRPVYYPHRPHPPARPQTLNQFPRIVDLRERESEVFPIDTEYRHPLRRLDDHLESKHTKSKHRNPNDSRNIQQASISIIGNEPTQGYVSRGSTSTDHGRDLPTVSDHGIVTSERQSHPSQQAGHNPAPTNAINEPRQSSGSRSRRCSRSRGFDNKETEYQSPARESPSNSRRKSSHRNMTYVDEPSTHRRSQANNSIDQQSSSSYDLRQTERTSRSKVVSTEDEQQTRERRTSRSKALSLNHEDHQQTRRDRKRSRSRRPSSISQGDKHQTESSRRTSTSNRRPLPMGHEHQQQTERSRRTLCRSSYGPSFYETTNSSRYTASRTHLPREPNVNTATRPPISMPQKMPSRALSSSTYDSGTYMSNTASYMSRNGSVDRNAAPESPTPRQRRRSSRKR